MTATTTPPALSRRQVLVIFLGLLLSLLIVGLDQTTVSVAAPTIVQDLGGMNDFAWVFTANLIAAAAAAPLFGKLSDLYGRRALVLTALLFFLVGSVACGLAQDMTQLILCRAIQGVGSGGLTAMVIVVVGEIVAPRARAGWQGYIGAELALANVVGPWFGGYLTDNLSWRWVFFVNVPIGLVALVVTFVTLRVPVIRTRAAVDWLGAGLLVAGLACLMLVFSWGGTRYAWGSSRILGLALATVLLLVVFVLVERRAAEPILPLRLFRNDVVTVALVLMFLAGASLFSMTFYMPAVLQIVVGVSATNSGLLLFPLMAGVVAMSIVSGHVVAATGRYRLWPIAGTAVAAVGLLLLSRITPATGRATAIAAMVVLGLGLGCIVQLMVVVTQNAVHRRDLGIATATTGLFRIVGGAVGTGLFGAILSSRLATAVAENLPPGALPPGVNPAFLAQQPAAAQQMPPPVRDGLAAAYADVFQVIFLVAAAIAVLAFVAALFLRQLPMRDDVLDPAATGGVTAATGGVTDTPGVPSPRPADPDHAGRAPTPAAPDQPAG